MELNNQSLLTSTCISPLRGSIRVPGDKSISHRAIMLAAIAEAKAGGASIYFAPEMSVLIDRDRVRSAKSIVAEESSAAVKLLCQAAKDKQIWVHCGSLPLESADG